MKCEYCFKEYDHCDCCRYCGFVKGTCECHLEGEYPCTKFHPSDAYKQFNLNKKLCEMFGMYSLSDIDDHVKRLYVRDVWPERLKQEEKDAD